jgi:hypothetical protein
MKACAVTVHTVEVFDHRLAVGERAAAVRAFVAEPFPDQLLVLLTVDSESPALGDSPAQFMEEHANDLVRNVGLSPSRR